MVTHDFGSNKILYTVDEKRDGRIEIHVHTINQSVRRIISNHTDDASFFLRNREKYAAENTYAKKWLARIVSEYRDKFIKNQVLFVIATPGNDTLSTMIKKPKRAKNVDFSPKISHKCSSLAELGFQRVGDCVIDKKLKSGVRYVIEKHKNDRVIYAFCVNDELKYFGVCDNTKTCFNERMKRD